jgi:hypothetical protein
MKMLALFCGFVRMSSVLDQGRQSNTAYVPARGCVSNEVVAVKIAEAVLIPVYGENQIASERPFYAALKDDIWTVDGTLTCPDGKGGKTHVCVGGTAQVRLSKIDGRILSMIHFK